MTEWNQVDHFKPYEFDDSYYPGSGTNIDMALVLNLDYLWERIKTLAEDQKPKIIITQGVDMEGRHGHSNRSLHLYKNGCQAADLIIFTSLGPRMQYRAVERQGFGGIGVYYDWKYHDRPVPIGFHVDLRPQEAIQRWTRRNGEYFYLLGR